MNKIIQLEDHHVHELSSKAELVNLMADTIKARPHLEDLSPPRFKVGHLQEMGIMPEVSRQNPHVIQSKFVSLISGKGHHGQVLRFDSQTGELNAIIRGKLFTAYRTAAASLAVARYFKPRVEHIVLIGTGEQSLSHFLFFRSFYPEAHISVVGRTVESLKAYQKKLMRSDLNLELKIPQRSAEIICTLTNSESPILNLDQSHAESLIIAVGSCSRIQRELSAELVTTSKRIVDSIPQAMREAGDYLLPIKEGLLKLSKQEEIAQEMGSYFRGEKEHPTGRIIYKSLGIAEQDIAFADYLLDKYHEHN
ncbi:MAG: hypothetical protein R3A80_04200 [Bdellovibrionota bacterium]